MKPRSRDGPNYNGIGIESPTFIFTATRASQIPHRPQFHYLLILPLPLLHPFIKIRHLRIPINFPYHHLRTIKHPSAVVAFPQVVIKRSIVITACPTSVVNKIFPLLTFRTFFDSVATVRIIAYFLELAWIGSVVVAFVAGRDDE